MNDYEDKEIVCISCPDSETFIWTAGEQRFMQRLLDDGKLTKINPPKRCPDCRAAKKQKFGDTRPEHQ